MEGFLELCLSACHCLVDVSQIVCKASKLCIGREETSRRDSTLASLFVLSMLKGAAARWIHGSFNGLTLGMFLPYALVSRGCADQLFILKNREKARDNQLK